MKNKNIKKQLIKESIIFVPDLKSKVFASVGCVPTTKNNSQKKSYLRLTPALGLLILLLVSLVLFVKPEPASNSFVIVEINPAIELELNKDNKVISASSLNTDGYFFLESLQIKDLDVEEALFIIVDEATKQGFLKTEDNKITISVVNENKKVEGVVSDLVLNIIEKHKPGIVNPNMELFDEAAMYNVTPGRMVIIKKAIEASPSLQIEVALKMEVKDLMNIINLKAKETVDKFEQDYKRNINHFENNYKHNLTELDKRKNSVKSRLLILKNKVESGAGVGEVVIYVNLHFPEYQIKPLDLRDLEGLVENIEEFYDDYHDFLEDVVKEYYNDQKQAYREKVSENLNHNKNDFGFEFEEDIWFKNYSNRYSKEERDVIKLINRISAMIKNNHPGGDRKISELYQDYIAYLAQTIDEFKNSNLIKDFEQLYSEYLNEEKITRRS